MAAHISVHPTTIQNHLALQKIICTLPTLLFAATFYRKRGRRVYLRVVFYAAQDRRENY